jgi:hypothetical protein
MKGLEIEAIYKDGKLELSRSLPLGDGQKVTITIHPPGGVATRSYGMLQSPLSPAQLEGAALDPELGLLESP